MYKADPQKTLLFYLLSVWFPPESIVVVLIITLTFFCTLCLSPLESLQWMKGQVINTTYLIFLIYSSWKTSYLATWKQQDNNTFIISRARSDLYHDLHITFFSFLALVSFNSCFDLNYWPMRGEFEPFVFLLLWTRTYKYLLFHGTKKPDWFFSVLLISS